MLFDAANFFITMCAGCSAEDLKGAGYSCKELKNAGCSAKNLVDAGN